MSDRPAERTRADSGPGAGTAAGDGRGVHGATFAAVCARLGGARVEHYVAVGAAEPFGARARVPVRGRALTRAAVQTRFVGAAVVQV